MEKAICRKWWNHLSQSGPFDKRFETRKCKVGLKASKVEVKIIVKDPSCKRHVGPRDRCSQSYEKVDVGSDWQGRWLGKQYFRVEIGRSTGNFWKRLEQCLYQTQTKKFFKSRVSVHFGKLSWVRWLSNYAMVQIAEAPKPLAAITSLIARETAGLAYILLGMLSKLWSTDWKN